MVDAEREERAAPPTTGGGDPDRRWRVVGLVAAALIVLSLPLHLALRAEPSKGRATEARYVGSERCASCHRKAYGAWKGSHHAHSMEAAREGSVLGDFGGATLRHGDGTWRFARRGDAFVATFEGPGGARQEHVVAYTFGVEPLQQYLVAFPSGRLQCLPAAWDVRARRWFLVSRNPDAPPGDWLHWTGQGQNWNSMCADCHSTAVKKGFDEASDTYRTTWEEIDVGCEACHGPASLHLAWAEGRDGARGSAAARGLVTRTTGDAQVAICAPCHSRRAQFADQGLPGGELLDRYLPSTLAAGVFHADGQIQDEDFEWQAFTESLMFARGVRCADCHDVHSGKRRAEGNALCTRCHDAEQYDAKGHHGHAPTFRGAPSAGVHCVSCHMAGQTYMGVHLRRDHSLRVPRPDLAARIGAPDGCSTAGCHADRSPSWVQGGFDRLYGRQRRAHFGWAIDAGRKGALEATPALAQLARNPRRPAVARATALELLADGGSVEGTAALERSLGDADPLVRLAAVSRLAAEPARLAKLLGPLLRDPVRAVRAEAALRLAGPPAELLPEPQREAHARALAEHVEAQRYLGDTPSGPFNLANLSARLGRRDEAERHYRRALAIDGRFHAATVNLAMLLAEQGRTEETERLLRAARADLPADGGIALDLGLVLAERGKRDEAEQAFRAALAAEPRLAQAAFNLAILLGDRSAAEALAFARRAAALAPGERRYAEAVEYFATRARRP